jgi:hypothetical protein
VRFNGNFYKAKLHGQSLCPGFKEEKTHSQDKSADVLMVAVEKKCAPSMISFDHWGLCLINNKNTLCKATPIDGIQSTPTKIPTMTSVQHMV